MREQMSTAVPSTMRELWAQAALAVFGGVVVAWVALRLAGIISTTSTSMLGLTGMGLLVTAACGVYLALVRRKARRCGHRCVRYDNDDEPIASSCSGSEGYRIGVVASTSTRTVVRLLDD